MVVLFTVALALGKAHVVSPLGAALIMVVGGALLATMAITVSVRRSLRDQGLTWHEMRELKKAHGQRSS